MTDLDRTALVHVLGFITGGALYALLAVMVVRRAGGQLRPAAYLAGNRLALMTAVLGLLWNAGALLVYGSRDLGTGTVPPWAAALAFAALGLLPAAVVHAALHDRRGPPATVYVSVGYALGGAAALLHVAAAARGLPVPSRGALLLLTVGFACVMAGLALQHRRVGGRRTLSVIALAVFAVSALHLGQHADDGEAVAIALIGHHASLPLALVILYQDYRFALTDVFLRRALFLVALVAVALAGYVWVAVPLLDAPTGSATGGRPSGAVILLGLWVGTALLAPMLARGTALIVDRLILRRPDYRRLRTRVARRLDRVSTVESALEVASQSIAEALAVAVHWQSTDDVTGLADTVGDFTRPGGAGRAVRVPTTDVPGFALHVGPLSGGRQLLSDDITLLEHVALLAGLRVDALRAINERFERDVREADIRRLASEAELSALRAQLDPHFLFNTLNTLGYLMRVSPERAQETLHQVSALLRSVVYRSRRAYCTLAEEVELVEAYLAIEAARFEERLQVDVDVPEALRSLLVPPLLLQPLVENAVKHGISPRRGGGRVIVAADMSPGPADGGAALADAPVAPRLHIVVRDTGDGGASRPMNRDNDGGVGLANLERRLASIYGSRATLRFQSPPGEGTQVDIWLPIQLHEGAPMVAKGPHTPELPSPMPEHRRHTAPASHAANHYQEPAGDAARPLGTTRAGMVAP